jgi:hypothetical protein
MPAALAISLPSVRLSMPITTFSLSRLSMWTQALRKRRRRQKRGFWMNADEAGTALDGAVTNGVGHIEREVELRRIGPASRWLRAIGEPLVRALYNTLWSATACRVMRCATCATTGSLECSAYA